MSVLRFRRDAIANRNKVTWMPDLMSWVVKKSVGGMGIQGSDNGKKKNGKKKGKELMLQE